METRSKSSSILRMSCVWIPVLALVIFETARIEAVVKYYATSFQPCASCVVPYVFTHDLLILGLLGGTHFLGCTVSRPGLSRLFRALAATGLVICVVDLVVFQLFSVRMSAADLGTIGIEFRSVISLFISFLVQQRPVGLLGTLIFTLLAISLALFTVRPIKLPLKNVVLASGVISLLPMGLADSTGFVAAWTFKNVLEVQVSDSLMVGYSDKFVSRMADPAIKMRESQKHCMVGKNGRQDIILVVVESLSSHQSKLFSAINDWTPQIDAFALRGQMASNFFANGYATSQGLAALLTGHDPLLTDRTDIFRRWRGTVDALPLRLRSQGYRSIFLTNSDLGFIKTGDFLQSIGFDEMEDWNHSWYIGAPRFNWGAPEDSKLYDRLIERVEARTNGQPLFVTAITVSSHQPYQNPRTRENTEEAAFRYVDQTLPSLIDRLKKSSFFDNGVLIVTGDHRAMIPVSSVETAKFGPSARARIPFFAMGKGIQERIDDRQLQQADFPSSIEYLVAPEACFRGRQRNIFDVNDSVGSRCILNARGDERDAVDAYCGSAYGLLRLNGDATRVESGSAPDNLIDEVNIERIGWGERVRPDGARNWSVPE